MNKKIEEYTLNAWPAVQTFLDDGWILRFANGYTKRSNSISPIYQAEEKQVINIVDKIQKCETIYASQGLDTIFKITPFVNPRNLDHLLEQMGYEVLDLSSVQTTELSGMEEPRTNHIVIQTELTDEWLSVMRVLNHLSETDVETTRTLLSSSYQKKGFFTLYDEHSIPVACGVGVIEENYVGLYDIVTDTRYRNQGHARELILHILKWAKNLGASDSYLLVVKDNAPAIRLYEKLGYREIYTYWYRRKKKQEILVSYPTF